MKYALKYLLAIASIVTLLAITGPVNSYTITSVNGNMITVDRKGTPLKFYSLTKPQPIGSKINLYIDYDWNYSN